MNTNEILRGMVLKLGTRSEGRGGEWLDMLAQCNCTSSLLSQARYPHQVLWQEADEGENVEEHVDYDWVQPIHQFWVLMFDVCAPRRKLMLSIQWPLSSTTVQIMKKDHKIHDLPYNIESNLNSNLHNVQYKITGINLRSVIYH